MRAREGVDDVTAAFGAGPGVVPYYDLEAAYAEHEQRQREAFRVLLDAIRDRPRGPVEFRPPVEPQR